MKIIINGQEVEVGGGASGGIPSGFIGMWSGETVPDGWALCDGTNGTPDLRGRFVLGESESHKQGETGGAETVTLTVAQMPKHSHNTKTENVNISSGSGTSTRPVSFGASTALFVGSSEVGSSQPHENMPPYYVLAYIMKL